MNHSFSSRFSPNQNTLARRGFTLVELLVAIGIIAVLAALLFPVFKNVSQRGKMTVCTNNMQQLGLAFQQYLLDHQQRYPGAGQFQKWGNGGHWVSGTNGAVSGAVAVPEASSLFKLPTPEEPSGGIADVEKGALYPYVKNAQVYVCPSSTYGELTRLSYSMNCAIAGLNATVRMKQPTQVNLLIDEAYANDGFFFADDADGSTDAMAQNHLNTANILFCDGHIKSYPFNSYPVDRNTGTTGAESKALKAKLQGRHAFGTPPSHTNLPSVKGDRRAPPMGIIQ